MNKPEIKQMPMGQIMPYARNSKTHPKEQVEKIARQISEVGFLVPIIIDKDGVIIAGHGRYQAAEALGLKEVPVIQADHLTEAQTKAFRIADNKVAESEWDLPLLAFELGSLESLEVDLTLTGFDMNEARSVLAKINGPDAPGGNGTPPLDTGSGDTEAPAQIQCPHCGESFQLKG